MFKFDKPDAHALATGAIVLGCFLFLVVVDRSFPGPK